MSRGLRAHADLRPARNEGHRLLGAEGKISRLALVHGEANGKTAAPQDRGDATIKPLGASGGGGLFSTADDYARFCEMLLEGGRSAAGACWRAVRNDA
jgi:CubicO group peptidase (beta-lactamase class C family)